MVATIVALSLLPSHSSPLLFYLPQNNNPNFLPSKQHPSITNTTQPKPSLTHRKRHHHSSTQVFSGGDDTGGSHHHGGHDGDDGGDGGNGGNGDDGGAGDNNEDDGGDDEGDDGGAGERNRAEAWLAAAEAGRSLDNLPKSLALAANEGRIRGMIITRYFELEKSHVFKWLLQFDGFRERLLADDLFLTKVGIECGIGLFTKTAAELNKRRGNFTKELDFVTADVIMALVADLLLVWLPAPTLSLRPPLALGVGPVAKFFYGCPDNAFQIAMAGSSYSIVQRAGALVRNGAKLFCVGVTSSLIGTGVTNLLLSARKALNGSFLAEAEDLPMVPTSLAYGAYLSSSANIRYQIIAGIIEQRMLEPFLHDHKLLLSTLCFAVRTGNTFLGSLMWVDFARMVGIQRTRS